MDPETLITLIGNVTPQLGLIALLIVAWWQERQERLQCMTALRELLLMQARLNSSPPVFGGASETVKGRP